LEFNDTNVTFNSLNTPCTKSFKGIFPTFRAQNFVVPAGSKYPPSPRSEAGNAATHDGRRDQQGSAEDAESHRKPDVRATAVDAEELEGERHADPATPKEEEPLRQERS
jgi:hypothetical protein